MFAFTRPSIRIQSSTRCQLGFALAEYLQSLSFLAMKSVFSNSAHSLNVWSSMMVCCVAVKDILLAYFCTKLSFPMPLSPQFYLFYIHHLLLFTLAPPKQLSSLKSCATGMGCARTSQSFVLIANPASRTDNPPSHHQHSLHHVQ